MHHVANHTLKYIYSLGICLMAGFVGSAFTTPAVSNWYATLNKPSFNPPNYVFAPVWMVLYILMGTALYFVWNVKPKNKKIKSEALRFFFMQLIFNVAWSIIFFALKLPTLALADIVLLWALIFLTIRSFMKISKPAAFLLYPYLAWVTFAAILNLSIVLLNKF